MVPTMSDRPDPDHTTPVTLHCTRDDLDALDRAAADLQWELAEAFPRVASGLTRESAALVLLRSGLRAHEAAARRDRA